jgi:hypothetical protein
VSVYSSIYHPMYEGDYPFCIDITVAVASALGLAIHENLFAPSFDHDLVMTTTITLLSSLLLSVNAMVQFDLNTPQVPKAPSSTLKHSQKVDVRSAPLQV